MLDRPPGPYRVFADRDVIDHLADLPQVRGILGGAKGDWRVRDVADGNLNAVFLVDGPQGGACGMGRGAPRRHRAEERGRRPAPALSRHRAVVAARRFERIPAATPPIIGLARRRRQPRRHLGGRMLENSW